MSLLDGCFTLDAVGMDFTEEMWSDVLFCKEHGSGSEDHSLIPVPWVYMWVFICWFLF